MECDDVIIIDCNEIPLLKQKPKSKRKKSKRAVTLNTVNENRETLIITQKVEVKKQKIKCVINLNTNVCNNTPKVGKDWCEKKFVYTERIVPKCARHACQNALHCRRRPYLQDQIRDRKLSYRTKYDTQNRKSIRHKESKFSKHSMRDDKKKVLNRIIDKSLSTISLSPLCNTGGKEIEISYDDISLESLNCSDTHLDTLIRRTRQREKVKSVQTLIGGPLYTSTPQTIIDLSSDEEDVQFIDTSIHSQATIVLESPTDNIHPSLKCINNETDFTYKKEIKTESKYYCLHTINHSIR